MGFPNLNRELTRARSGYLGALRRLDLAMDAFGAAGVPLAPAEGGRLADWSREDVEVMRTCAEAWSAVILARRGLDAALRDLAVNG